MSRQYSDSSGASRLTLAFDTGSPVTSVALGRGGEILASLEARGGRSSASLLTLIDRALDAASVRIADVDRLIAARGPGSFTGLRVGLATALGFHQALGLTATAVGTLETLGRSAPDGGEGGSTVAVVDALRDEWYTQTWHEGDPAAGAAEITAGASLIERAPCRIVGFELEKLPPEVHAHAEVEIIPASALAPVLLAMAQEPEMDWNPRKLIEPLYLRGPAAQRGTPPRVPDRRRQGL